MKPLSFAALVLSLGVAAGAASPQDTAQQPPIAQPEMGMHGSMPMHHPPGTQHQMTGMRGPRGMGDPMQGAGHSDGMPAASGQAAFGAIQEIVDMLQSDPMTNWSKVDIDALRQHLIDMDEVTLRADVRKEPIEKGLRIMVTGSGRTLEAIQRMVPAHAQDINGLSGWSVQAKPLPNGQELAVTGNAAADAQKIQALGFMGVMVLGTHQMHHLAMAKGEFSH